MSRYDDAARIGLVFTPGLHVEIDGGPWLESLKDRVGNDRLFLYYNVLHQSFVLAAWVYSPEETDLRPIAMELEVFEDHPMRTPPSMSFEVLVKRCQPIKEEESRTLRGIRERRYREAERKREQREGQLGLAKHYRKKGLHHLAAMVESGQVQVGVPDMHSDKTRELEYAARGIIHGDMASSGVRRYKKRKGASR